MHPVRSRIQRLHSRLAMLGGALILAGCTSAQMSSQWKDLSQGGRLSAGSRVVVACVAADDAARRICEDNWAERLHAKGLDAVRGYGLAGFPADPGREPGQAHAVSHSTGAAGLIQMKLAAGPYTGHEPGPQVGFGIGGGSGSGVSYGGIGISLPIGGSPLRQVLTASTTLTDVARNAVIWSGTARIGAGGHLAAQVSELTEVTVDAMKRAGVLP